MSRNPAPSRRCSKRTNRASYPLLFNQGYSAHDADESTRHDLCVEAVRLAQLLVAYPESAHPASWALLALLHFHTARLRARRDAGGDLLMLEEQDRAVFPGHSTVVKDSRGMATPPTSGATTLS